MTNELFPIVLKRVIDQMTTKFNFKCWVRELSDGVTKLTHDREYIIATMPMRSRVLLQVTSIR